MIDYLVANRVQRDMEIPLLWTPSIRINQHLGIVISIMILYRYFIAAVGALLIAGCVSMERPLPLAEVSGWRIADIRVAYLPTADVNLGNRFEAVALRRNDGQAIPAAPVDPANPGRNFAAEQVEEIAKEPAVVEQVRSSAANDVAQAFRRGFSTTPSGPRPVRMLIDIAAIHDFADQGFLNVKVRFVDVGNGQLLLVNEGVGHLRPSRRAQAVGAVIGGGLGGLLGVAIASAIQDSGRPPPFQDAVEETALRLRTWLMKPDSAS